MLVDIAEVLKVSTDELLFGSESKAKENNINQLLILLNERNETEQKIMLDIMQATANALQKYAEIGRQPGNSQGCFYS